MNRSAAPEKAKPKTLLSWSSGKDSAWTLHLLRRQGVEVVGLLTTLNREFDRVAMHGTRRRLLEAQAAAAGLPLWPVDLPWPCTNADYERKMAEVWERAASMGIDQVAFGDLFLADIREYRERGLEGTGLKPVFPLWQPEDGTRRLAMEMLRAGLRATLTCLDPKQVDPRFAGRTYDATLLAELPASVDPCGEKGEFHTFCHAGPMFSAPIRVAVGETLERDGFVFTDLS